MSTDGACRHACRRSGTRRGRCSPCAGPASHAITRRCDPQSTGCSPSRSAAAATGRSRFRSTSAVGGRSSSTTTSIRTSTTPLWSPWRCSSAATPAQLRDRYRWRCAGAGRCDRAMARGAHSTRTTHARWCIACRSPTSARCSIRRRRTSPHTSSSCWPPPATGVITRISRPRSHISAASNARGARGTGDGA